MDDILFVLVTCTREDSRQIALNLCVESIVKNFSNEIIRNNFIVFDNNSSIAETHKLIDRHFKNVIKSKTNVGLWSGVAYVLENYQEIIGKKFNFVFPIESDNFLYDIERLNSCTEFLSKNQNVSMMRLKELDVNNLARFDKSRSLNLRSEITLKNLVTGEMSFFNKTEYDGIYETNLHPVLPALHRLNTLKDVLDLLRSRSNFDERDFWITYQALCKDQNSSLLNMGLYYEVVYDHDILTSVNNEHLANKVGYHNSRQSNTIRVPSI